MTAVALAVAGMFPPVGVDLLFPGRGESAGLRVTVTAAGRSPEPAWRAFLDALFDHFDRDGDGVLSAAEAGRVFPLPLPGGREAKMDFPRLDADRDGKGTRPEFREFYRAAGFAPAVAVVRPPAPDHRRLSDAVFRHLDRDGDGKLSRGESEKAPALLRRFDENEDEVLTPAELLALEPDAGPAPGRAAVEVVPPGDPRAAALLRLDLGSGRNPPAGGAATLRVPGGFATVVPAARGADPFRAAKGFYLAQFRDAAGDKPGLGKPALEQDPALAVFAGLFDAADRDGGGTLTAAEVAAFLDLVELGVGCQAVVTVEDRGPDLFGLLDADGDGRLDLAELNGAARAVGAAAPLPLGRDDVPRRFRLSAGRGPVGPAFGPVPVPAAAAPKAPGPAPAARGPRWFRAADRNGDGFVSPAEFVGPPDLFRKLDADADGRISPEEAAAAEPPSPPRP